MRRFIESAKFRLGGNIASRIKRYDAVISNLRDAKTSAPKDMLVYLELYEHCFCCAKKRQQIFRFVPDMLGGSNLIKLMKLDWTNMIQRMCETLRTEDGKLQIKNIMLPVTQPKDITHLFRNAIFDTLTPYILEGAINDGDLSNLISELTNEGPYEYKQVALASDDIVIDAGSCMGEFSALASVKGCKVYAFEPVPEIVQEYLSKTAEWNKNIEIIEFGLSDKESELTLTVIDELGSSSGFIVREQAGTDIVINTITLDDFVCKNNLPRVDFIKADIEGAERLMLKGAKNVLRDFAPKLAICDYHLPDDPQVLRDLILDANPNYVIEHKYKKIFAYVP